MNTSDIRNLFSYNDWANRKIMGAVTPLTNEQFTRKIESSFPSIRETLAHIIGAEWLWLRRWKGESPPAFPEWSEKATIDGLTSNLRSVERERHSFLGSITDDMLEKPITYRNFRGQEWTYSMGDMFVHLVNHSTYHRGQLTTMLRQVGAKVASTDLLLMRDEGS